MEGCANRANLAGKSASGERSEKMPWHVAFSTRAIFTLWLGM